MILSVNKMLRATAFLGLMWLPSLDAKYTKQTGCTKYYDKGVCASNCDKDCYDVCKALGIPYRSNSQCDEADDGRDKHYSGLNQYCTDKTAKVCCTCEEYKKH